MNGNREVEAVDLDECLKKADYVIIGALSDQAVLLLNVPSRQGPENTVVHSAALAEPYRAARLRVSGSPACHRIEIHQDHSDDIRHILMRSKHACFASDPKHPLLRLPHE